MRNAHIIALGFFRYRIFAGDGFKRGTPVIRFATLMLKLFDDERQCSPSHTDNSEIGRACDDLCYGRRSCRSLLAPLLHQLVERFFDIHVRLKEKHYILSIDLAAQFHSEMDRTSARAWIVDFQIRNVANFYRNQRVVVAHACPARS